MHINIIEILQQISQGFFLVTISIIAIDSNTVRTTPNNPMIYIVYIQYQVVFIVYILYYNIILLMSYDKL